MPDKLIVKQYDSETKAVENERSLTVTISTNAVDRSGDVVEPNGGKFINFKKNPVVLMAHDYSGLPIGKASDLVKTDNGITAKVTFPEEGTYPLADTVYNMYKQKFMRAWSIGFIPTKSEEIKDDEGKKYVTGYRFLNWELLEFSACSVPANPEALTNMVSKGIDIGLLKEEGLIEIVEGKEIEKVEEKEKYDCECIDCDYKMTSDKHCKEIKCPKCGGTMRRVERPGPGEDSKAVEDEIANDDPRLLVPLDVTKELIEELTVKDTDGKDLPKGTVALIEDGEVKYLKEETKEEYLEKIELFESMTTRFLPMYLVEHKQRLISEALYNDIKKNELKAGAVLNAKNKKYLADSLTNIQAVLDSAGTTEESIKDVDEIDYDKGDDNVIEITHDTVDDILIDETKAEQKDVVSDTYEISDEVMKNLVNDELDYVLGRASK